MGSFAKAAAAYNKSSTIPGVSGRQVPGSARLPKAQLTGGFLTNVGFQQEGSATFREYHRQQVRDARGRFAGGWGFAWQGLEQIDSNITELNKKWHRSIRQAAERLKDEMVAYAQQNAPWEDHPGENEDARQNIQGAVVWQDEEHFTIFLGHGPRVYYGIWLEVRWGGKYAIILPTIQKFGPQLGDRVRTLT